MEPVIARESLRWIPAVLTVANAIACVLCFFSLMKSAGSISSDRWFFAGPAFALFSVLLIVGGAYLSEEPWLKYSIGLINAAILIAYLFITFLSVVMAGG